MHLAVADTCGSGVVTETRTRYIVSERRFESATVEFPDCNPFYGCEGSAEV